MNCSLLVSSVHEISQARILEWIIISFSRGSSHPRDWTCVSWVSYTAGRFFTTSHQGRPYIVSVSQSVQLLSPVWLFAAHGLQYTRLPCPSLTPGVCSCPSSQWCHPIISSSVIPFSYSLQSCPASGSFPISQFFASGGQSIRISASASVFQWIFMTDFL